MKKSAAVIITTILIGLLIGSAGTASSAKKVKVPGGRDIVPNGVTVVSQTTVVGKAVKKKPAKKMTTQREKKSVHKVKQESPKKV